MKKLLFTTFFCAIGILLFGQTDSQSNDDTARTVYVQPTKIIYFAKPEIGTCEMSYRIKVKNKDGWVKKSTFGFDARIFNGDEFTSFDNLDEKGRMNIGKYKANELITVLFDSWEDDKGGRFEYNAGDDDYPDVESSVQLNGLTKVKGVAFSTHGHGFRVEYLIYQE